MRGQNVTVFKPYPFTEGQKIRISRGPRAGDWEVIEASERKVKLRCPLSGREVEWDNFCYFAEEHEKYEWPEKQD